MGQCLLLRAAHLRFLGVFYHNKDLRRFWRGAAAIMNTDTIICRLKERRTSLGFTQRQVAEGTEMNVRTVINIEKGTTIPNLLYAMKLAKFLRLRVEEVFEYND